MKNVTKILTAVVLCAALFASDQRIDALGGNAAFWPGDEANIAAFPAQMNNHAFVQLTGVGGTDNSAAILWNADGTTWGFDYNNTGANNDWFNVSWGNGDMGVKVGFLGGETDNKAGNSTSNSGYDLGWGKAFSWGEIGVGMTSSSVETKSAATVAGGAAATDATCTFGGVAQPWAGTSDQCYAGGGTLYTPATESTLTVDADANVNTVDNSSMSLNFTTAKDLWIFDTIVANYTSNSWSDQDTGETKDSRDWTSMGADFVSHMSAGAADVVFAMGILMTDDGRNVQTAAQAAANNNPKFTDCTLGDANCAGSTTSQTATLGVEANMTDWATARVGVNHNWICSSDTNTTGSGDWGWAFGLGFNWGGFTADYTINDSVFQDPIGTVTGYGDGGLTTESVTFTYSF